MEYEVYPIFSGLVVIGFCIGVCVGCRMIAYWDNYVNPPHKTKMLEKLVFSQRDSLRSLRLEFNNFRNGHEKELMTILRETLRTSPRSSADEPNGQTE
jgi:hypothetical protein